MQILPTSALTRNGGLTLPQPRAQAASSANTSSANTSSTSSTSEAASAAANSAGSLTSEQTFLQLLIAQIQNQDPLNPTDSIQFVGQLVQYSELEQLMGINQGVQTLAGNSSTTSTSSTQSSSNNSTGGTSAS